MNDQQTIIPLTEEDRRLLKKRCFRVWTLYKWLLIGLAGVFGSSWLWIGWSAIYYSDVEKIFLPITFGLAGMGAFAWWSTSVYKAEVAAPLEQDLRVDRKIQKVGQIIALKRWGKYSQKLIFRAQDQTDTEEFVLNSRIYYVNGDVFILGREAELEYTPHARFLLSIRLLVPLMPATAEQQQR